MIVLNVDVMNECASSTIIFITLDGVRHAFNYTKKRTQRSSIFSNYFAYFLFFNNSTVQNIIIHITFSKILSL